LDQCQPLGGGGGGGGGSGAGGFLGGAASKIAAAAIYARRFYSNTYTDADKQEGIDLFLGRAVQVDPIKPTLKAPGTKRLKLKYDELLSHLAFKFNLRRYTWVTTTQPPSCRAGEVDC